MEGMRSLPPSAFWDRSPPACSLIMYSELDAFPDNISGSCISFIQQVGLADSGHAWHELSMHPGISQWGALGFGLSTLMQDRLRWSLPCMQPPSDLPGTRQQCLTALAYTGAPILPAAACWP